MSRFKSVLKISGADALASASSRLRAIPAVLHKAARDAATDVALDVMREAPRDLSQRYNLPASYIKDNLKFRPAGEDGVAVISARVRFTRLARFDARQLTAEAKRDKRGRSRAKGDPRRGIAAGRKQAGVSVKVMRTGPREKFTRSAFLLPLRAGKEPGANGMGLFERVSNDRIEHLYGPSPYQTFRWWGLEHGPEMPARVRKVMRARLARELKRVRG